MSHTPIRILIVDDHPVVRSGLAGMLSIEPDLDIVGEASNGAEAVRLVAELHPDVVLMDLRMPVSGSGTLMNPGLDGVGATKQIIASGTAASPAPRILILTTFDTDADILRAVEAGATGYLLKDTPHEVLVNGVRAAARGETVLAPTVSTRLLGNVRASSERLTPRETEVLALVAEGLSNPAIAAQLFVGEATVKTHLVRVFNKLGVADRTAAVTEARRRGFLS